MLIAVLKKTSLKYSLLETELDWELEAESSSQTVDSVAVLLVYIVAMYNMRNLYTCSRFIEIIEFYRKRLFNHDFVDDTDEIIGYGIEE